MNTVFSLSLRSAARDPLLLFWSVLLPLAGTIGLGMLIDQPDYNLMITTGMMAFGIFYYAFAITVFSVMYQRKRGVYQLLRVTPMPLWRYILSVSSASTVFSLLCAGLVLTVGSIVFDFRPSFLSLIMMAMVCVLAAGGYVFLGYFISGLCKTDGQAAIGTNLITLPFMLCSSAFYSLEGAPSWVQLISSVNPFEWFVSGLRTGFSMDVTGWLASMAVLLLILLITLFLAVRSFDFNKA